MLEISDLDGDCKSTSNAEGATRRTMEIDEERINFIVVGNMILSTDYIEAIRLWQKALKNVARAHVNRK